MVAERIREDQPTNTILKLIADDKNSVAYRPSFARLTGGATAAILLQQIVYWWSKAGCKAFFKFKEPCAHKAYKAGDSWCEELALSRAEFDSAFDKICTKVGKDQTSAAVQSYQLPRREDFASDMTAFGHAMIIAVQHMILVWRDGDNKTWYQVNVKLFTELVELLYDATDANVEILLSVANARNSRYLGKVKSSRSLGNARSSRYPLTETTQETTQGNTNTLSQPASQVPTDGKFKADRFYPVNSSTKQVVLPGALTPDIDGDWAKLGEDWKVIGGLALLANINGKYTDHAGITLSEALESRSKVPPKVSPPPSYVAPSGTRWIYPLDGIHCHLVRDANQPTVTLCGISPLPSYASTQGNATQVQCAACLKAAEKKPKEPKHERTPQPTDPLFDALALFLFSAKTKADQHAVAGRVGQIMYGDKRSGRCAGLIAYEKERKGIESLDFGALAKDVERFWSWFKQDHPDLDLKDCAKVMEWWVKFRSSNGQHATSNSTGTSSAPNNGRGESILGAGTPRTSSVPPGAIREADYDNL